MASRANRDVEPDRRRPDARGNQHRDARRAGIWARHGFARTGAERLAPGLHRDSGVQSPVGWRQDRELHSPPAGPTDFGTTALHRELDHGACLTPVVLRCGTPRCARAAPLRVRWWAEAEPPALHFRNDLGWAYAVG